MNEQKCDCANMNGYMCYPCLTKDYYAISADNFRLLQEIERLRAEVARLGSFLHPVGAVVTVHEGKNFDAEKIAELVVKAVRGE